MRTRHVVALALVALVAAACGGGGAAHLEPSKSTLTETAVSPVRLSPMPSIAAPVAVPTRLEVPAIGVAVSLVQTGQNRDGSLQVPAELGDASWWRDSARPGQLGPAILLGHTALDDRGGVFARLGELKTGDTIRVTSGDQVRTFVVTRTTQTAKAAFPSAEVTGPTVVPALRLISCTGPVDTSVGHHTDNRIVYAEERS